MREYLLFLTDAYSIFHDTWQKAYLLRSNTFFTFEIKQSSGKSKMEMENTRAHHSMASVS